MSTGTARAIPPRSLISRLTVWIVDADELGSGGNGASAVGSVSDLEETTTV